MRIPNRWYCLCSRVSGLIAGPANTPPGIGRGFTPTAALVMMLLVFGVSCSITQGGADSSGQPTGYGAIIYLNKSSFLVQAISALAYKGEPPVVWVNAVAPGTWDPLLFECGFTQVSLVSAIPISLSTGTEGETVDFELDALRDEKELTCGSLIVVTISDGPSENGAPPLTLTVERLPETLPAPLSDNPTSAVSPGNAGRSEW